MRNTAEQSVNAIQVDPFAIESACRVPEISQVWRVLLAILFAGVYVYALVNQPLVGFIGMLAVLAIALLIFKPWDQTVRLQMRQPVKKQTYDKKTTVTVFVAVTATFLGAQLLRFLPESFFLHLAIGCVMAGVLWWLMDRDQVSFYSQEDPEVVATEDEIFAEPLALTIGAVLHGYGAVNGEHRIEMRYKKFEQAVNRFLNNEATEATEADIEAAVSKLSQAGIVYEHTDYTPKRWINLTESGWKRYVAHRESLRQAERL